MKKALIITCSKYKDHEIIYPYYALLAAGFDVTIVADQRDSKNRVYGVLGAHSPCHMLIDDFVKNIERNLHSYDLLYIPGGADNTEKLRQIKPILDFIFKWNALEKCILSICHGAQVLISSKIVKNRNISGYYSVKDDIENAGANFVDAPFVIDNNLVTSPHYDHMHLWLNEGLKVYNKIVLAKTLDKFI